VNVATILATKGDDVVTVDPSEPTWVVLEQLVRRGISAMVLSSGGRRFDGIVTDRDIIRSLVTGRGQGALTWCASDLVHGDPPTCSPSTSILDVMTAMTRRRARHVVVLDDDGRLAGIVSIGDVVKARLGDLELQSTILREAYLAVR
jgi:CBS domain-containing protein